MSGHSKWKTIKHKKGAADAKRGQLFTKIAREITVAARQGGPDSTTNVRLRFAVQKARDNNMPMDNVERAINKGAGLTQDGSALEELTYEGYGPGGAAVLIQALTDNRNRTVSEIKHVFSKSGGNLAATGAVSWIFDSSGVMIIEKLETDDAESIALEAIDSGVDDFKVESGLLELYMDPSYFESVRSIVESKGSDVSSAELSMIPKNTIALGVGDSQSTLRLLDSLEDLDDVQKVFTNADFDETALEQYM